MYNIDSAYVGSRCELLTMDNKILTNGRLLKAGYDFIEVSNDVKTLKLMRYDEPVKVEIRHGSLPTVVVSGRLYLPNMNFFRIVDMDALSKNDSRAFFRVNINDKIYITKKLKNGELSMNFEVMLVDLSLGGALIKSQLTFEVGTNVLMGIMIDNERVFFNAIIVRILPPENLIFRYGLMFSNLKDAESDRLCKFLFSKQKDIIKDLKK